jgi:hypothetical protein
MYTSTRDLNDPIPLPSYCLRHCTDLSSYLVIACLHRSSGQPMSTSCLSSRCHHIWKNSLEPKLGFNGAGCNVARRAAVDTARRAHGKRKMSEAEIQSRVAAPRTALSARCPGPGCRGCDSPAESMPSSADRRSRGCCRPGDPPSILSCTSRWGGRAALCPGCRLPLAPHRRAAARLCRGSWP